MMRTGALRALALCAFALALGAAPAQAEFGLQSFDATYLTEDGEVELRAGVHPYAFETSLLAETVPLNGGVAPEEQIKDVEIAQMPGFVGDQTGVEQCRTAVFLPTLLGTNATACPDSSVVGLIEVTLSAAGDIEHQQAPLYNLVPPPGKAAELGFQILDVPVTIEATVRDTPPYNLLAQSRNVSQVLEFFGAEVTLWGVPGAAAHDEERGACYKTSGTCPTGQPPVPFLTTPRACTGPLETEWEADSWLHPGRWVSGFSLTHDGAGDPAGFFGCGALPFAPTVSAQPTSRAAQSPTGLDFSLEVSDEGLKNDSPEARSAADVEELVLTLPRGMSANPSLAEGLETCSEAELAAEKVDSAPGEGCPQASKIGTVSATSPLVDEALTGSLFIAEPYANPFGSLIAVYVVVRNERLGVIFRQPVEVKPDPDTGQLVSTAEEMPPWPISNVRLHFREGARSPLITPPGCGTHTVEAMLYPSSGGPPVEASSEFEIIAGPNGGPCPSGPAPFSPGFEAGTTNNAAGTYSPFTMRLTRSDGEQDMGRFSFTLPPGVVPKLAGIPYCSDAAIARARARTGAHGGQEEIDDPSCPAASQIGTTVAGAGAGSQLTYVPGRLYLAGPYNGDPISAVAITPAVAGPFDAGVVVVREALRLNPVTHVGEVDGSASDPIPHILKGIPLNLRDLRVYADRPEFTLNPTSCEVFEAQSTIWGDGTALEPLAPHPVERSSRFQAAGCASLGFEPRLALRLYGGTRRGGFPALRAVYAPRPGEQANLSRLALTFPNSEFIEQGHFRTICTRVQFAAGAGFGSQCPKGSIYGHIKVWTPLLDEPLQGPVYLRSSDHNLPDAVFALHGLVDIELATRIDSVNGRLRAIVSGAPDAPVSRAVVQMQGGQKGLFVNSRNLCVRQRRNRARVNAGAQNGRREVTRPVMRAAGCAKRKAKRNSQRRAGLARAAAVR